MFRLFFLLLFLLPSTAFAIEFALPVDCIMSKDCFIQKYVDTDAGKTHRDYSCGLLSSPNHKGTDFRVRDFVALEKGVPVIATAEGIVKAVRDGEEDILIENKVNHDASRDCGNAVVISHGSGWQTQYCHLRKGSLAVKEGQHVKQGQLLGLMGLSGNTSFPHLHLGVTYYGKPIDPFTSQYMQTGCNTTTVFSLWNVEAMQSLHYIPSTILIFGVSDSKPLEDDARNGKLKLETLTSQKQIFVWADIMGPTIEHTLSFELFPPAEEKRTLEITFGRTQALNFYTASFNAKGKAWPTGQYKAKISLMEDNKVSAEEIIRFTVK